MCTREDHVALQPETLTCALSIRRRPLGPPPWPTAGLALVRVLVFCVCSDVVLVCSCCAGRGLVC